MRRELGPRLGELARHWAAAAAPDEPKRPSTYSRRAGERALAELAPDEAVRWFARPSSCSSAPRPRPGRAPRLLLALGEAQLQAGPRLPRDPARAARAAADRRRRRPPARAALANSRGFASSFGAVDRERLAGARAGHRARQRLRPARCARLLALQAMELQFDPDHERRRALADRALALARESGDLRILPYVLRDHFHAIWSADTVQARLRIAEQMTELAQLVDDPLARIWALDRTVHAAVEAGALRGAGEASTMLLALTQELGQPGLRWHATYYAAGLAQMRGDLARADELAEAAFHLAQHDCEPDALVVYFGQIGALRSEQGRPEEVVEVLRQAVADNPGIPAFAAGLGAVLCDLGLRRRGRGAPRARTGERLRHRPQGPGLLHRAERVGEGRRGRRSAARRPPSSTTFSSRGRGCWCGTGPRATGPSRRTSACWPPRSATATAPTSTTQPPRRCTKREDVRGWEARNLCFQAGSLIASGARDEGRAAATHAISLGHESGFNASVRRAEALLEPAATQ